MAELFNFEIHTPYRRFFYGKAEAIVLTLTDGEIGIYAKHAPFSAPTVSGILRIKDDKGEWKSAFITEGILEVKGHKNVLIVDAAEWPEEIDHDRAVAAKKEAEQAIEMAMLKFEVDNAKTKLRKAEYRLRVCESDIRQKTVLK